MNRERVTPEDVREERPLPGFVSVINAIAIALQLAGVAVIVASLATAAAKSTSIWRSQGGAAAYAVARSTFGRGVLLGLEILVAGDIIRTVALQPSLGNLEVLGFLVVIRTFLAWSLEVEIDGQWPWRRSENATLRRT